VAGGCTLETIIEALKLRKLQIDFVHLELTQNKSGSDAIAYTGNGYIRQTVAMLA
jgi:hypothetical protein